MPKKIICKKVHFPFRVCVLSVCHGISENEVENFETAICLLLSGPYLTLMPTVTVYLLRNDQRLPPYKTLVPNKDPSIVIGS